MQAWYPDSNTADGDGTDPINPTHGMVSRMYKFTAAHIQFLLHLLPGYGNAH